MPKFLEDKPTVEDTLWNKWEWVHKRLTDTLESIVDTLSQEHSIKNIIGLFWYWGSWKSSIIKMLEEKKEKYKILEFDSWSHKDEFLRRAFLIELTKKLEFDKKTLWEIWFKNKKIGKINSIDYLSKKNLVKVLNIEPETNFSWIWFIWALVLFFVLLKLIWIDIISILHWWLNPFLNLETFTWFEDFYFQYLDIFNVLFLIILIAIFYFWFYPHFKNKEDKDSTGKTEWFKWLIDYILFKKINYNETLTSSENQDFSNYDYQEYFTTIVKKYLDRDKGNKDKLIIVLDNLDRVKDETVLNSISLIQTTLEWINDEFDTKWGNIFDRLIFILPIDKDRLKTVFEKLLKDNDDKESFVEWFIDKTFSVIVDVPNLEQSDWRPYFKNNISQAFNDIKIKNREIDELISMFYSYVSNSWKKVTPREIINFINELVSNYLYWDIKIALLKQWEYIGLKRYKLTDSDKWKTWIKKNWKYSFNKEIVKQFFKTDDIYDILYLDEIVTSLQEWDSKSFDQNYSKIDSTSNRDKLLENAYDKILKNKDINIQIIWNMINVIFENSNISQIYKDKLQNNLNDNFWDYPEFVEKIDRQSSEWILRILNEYSDNKDVKHIKGKLPKTLLEIIILSNKSKKDGEKDDR